MALRVARELREGGISTQALRRVVDRLRRIKGLENPLAKFRLVVVGSDVKLVNSCEEVISLLDKPGQAAFSFKVNLERTNETIKTEVKALRELPKEEEIRDVLPLSPPTTCQRHSTPSNSERPLENLPGLFQLHGHAQPRRVTVHGPSVRDSEAVDDKAGHPGLHQSA